MRQPRLIATSCMAFGLVNVPPRDLKAQEATHQSDATVGIAIRGCPERLGVALRENIAIELKPLGIVDITEESPPNRDTVEITCESEMTRVVVRRRAWWWRVASD